MRFAVWIRVAAGLVALLSRVGSHRPELGFSGVCLCGYFFVLFYFLSPGLNSRVLLVVSVCVGQLSVL